LTYTMLLQELMEMECLHSLAIGRSFRLLVIGWLRTYLQILLSNASHAKKVRPLRVLQHQYQQIFQHRRQPVRRTTLYLLAAVMMTLKVCTSGTMVRKMESTITRVQMATLCITFTMVCSRITGFVSPQIMTIFISLSTRKLGTSLSLAKN